MNLARLLRFFGLRPRHAPGYRTRLSLRMSRVFHRRSWSARRSSAMNSSSNNNVSISSVIPPEPTAAVSPAIRRRRLGSTLYIPENQPVALDWGVNNSSSSRSMDLRRSPRTRLVDVESRLLVQRLILEELQNHNRRRKQPVTRDSRMAMIEHAEALSKAFLEGRGSELLPPARTSTPEEGEAGGGGGVQRLTWKEEKKLRKSVARAIRSDEKQQKKLEKLNKQRAKQYARAQAFFEQTTGVMQDVSLYRTSFNVPRGSATYRFDMNAGDARWRRLSSESLSSSLTRQSKQDSETSSSLGRSKTKPPRMEFLFFGGSAEDVSWNELEFGCHQFRPSTSAAAFGIADAATSAQRTLYTGSIKDNPTLLRGVPRFAPRMNTNEIFI